MDEAPCILVSSLNQTLAVYSMLAMAAARDFDARTHASMLTLFFASSGFFSLLARVNAPTTASGDEGGGGGGDGDNGDDCGGGECVDDDFVVGEEGIRQ